MSGELTTTESTSAAALPPWQQQRKNLVLFASCVALQYLSAPVIYVGITQGSLLDKLGAPVEQIGDSTGPLRGLSHGMGAERLTGI